MTHDVQSTAPPARVVVLGASGFVGRELVGQLDALGIDTIGLSSREVDLFDAGSVYRLLDILRRDDALVFAAALTPERGKDARTLMRNLTMGQHVTAALEREGCAHIIYISSDAVYDDQAGPITEATPTAPPSLYGLMHLTREKMLAQAATKTATPFLVLRPCALYGAADTHNSYGPNRFVRTALSERKVSLFGAGEEKRDHVAATDFVQLIGQMLARRTVGTLNVATGKAVSFGEAARLVAEVCDGGVEIECRERTGPITHRHFDNTALLQAFPTFAFTPLRAGLRVLADQLQQRPHCPEPQLKAQPAARAG